MKKQIKLCRIPVMPEHDVLVATDETDEILKELSNLKPTTRQDIYRRALLSDQSVSPCHRRETESQKQVVILLGGAGQVKKETILS